MRPVELTMTAFGPYRQSETIDFNKLKEYGLFAVSGPTGAGKTTIFDAICFALYGQASGEDRADIRALRSDFAHPDVQTAVELKFSIQNRLFRVFRQVPYIKKGNKSETSGRVEFFELMDSGEVPVTDRQIVSEVNKKIEELIGFTLAQFSQIVMLPQGEFRKFLTSDTENKESILRKIFKTEQYRAMAEKLKKKKDIVFSDLSASHSAAAQIIKQLTVSLPSRKSILFTELQAESIHYNRVLDALKLEITYYEQQAKTHSELYRTAYAEHEKAQKSLSSAQLVNQQFEELEKKKLVLHTLSTKKEEIEAVRAELKRAEQAVLIETKEMNTKETSIEAKKKQEDVSAAEQKVKTTRHAASVAEQELIEEEKKQSEREESAIRLITLQSYLPIVKEISTSKKEIDILTERAHESQKLLLQLQKEESENITLVEQTTKKLTELERMVEGYESLLDELAEAKSTEQKLARFGELQHTIQRVKQEVTTKRNLQEQTERELITLESKWLTNQATQLAATLEEGKPCPVCGSANHPKIQTHSTNLIVSKEDIETSKLSASAAYKELQVLELQLQNYVQEVSQLEQDLNGSPKPEDHHASQLRVQQLTESLGRMRNIRNEIPVIKDQNERNQNTLVAQQQQIKLQEKTADKEVANLKEAKSVLAATIKNVPENFQELSTLEREIKQVEQKKLQLQREWERIKQVYQSASEAKQNAATTLSFAQKALEEAEEKYKIAEKLFTDSLLDSSFETDRDFQLSKRTATERENLASRIQDFEIQYRTTTEMILELEHKLKGKQRIAVDVLQNETDNWKQTYEQEFNEWHKELELEKSSKSLYNRLSNYLEEQGDLELRYSRITELYDLVRGHNDSKLSFERYLQTEYLERILYAANGRLEKLSNGQFQLQRSDRQESRGKQSGLGIDVYDEYTGLNRDVKTLSGGEKFNASLSLALGMADVIQSFQGSISIETMFIDEGFGSLDADSLQNAIDTLIGLQKAGRMIGVISHVSELKDAFPAVLRVEKTKEGHSFTKIDIL